MTYPMHTCPDYITKPSDEFYWLGDARTDSYILAGELPDNEPEQYASTIYDLLVQLNDGTYSRDVDEAEEAKQRLFLLYPIQSGYDPGRCWYANSGPASILSRADRVEVYHGMHCTFYAPEETDKAIADFAAGA